MHPFQVMAEPVRRRIVEILASGEHASGEISAAVCHDFGITRSAVGRHLAILLDEHWVAVRPDYSHRYYRLDVDALTSLRNELEWLEYLWERRVGITARNDPQPHHAEPFQPSSRRRTSTRPLTGSRKGLRGKGRRDHPGRA